MAIIIEEICFAPGRKRVKTLLRAPARYTRGTVQARLNPLSPLHPTMVIVILCEWFFSSNTLHFILVPIIQGVRIWDETST